MRRLSFISLAIVLSSLIACGTSGGPAVLAGGTAPRSTPNHGRPPIDWNHPINGHQVTSRSAAQPDLTFQSRDPQGLSNLKAIFETGAPNQTPTVAERAGKALAFVYDDSTYNRVVVIEQALNESETELLDSFTAAVANNNQPNVSGSAEIVTIRKSISALVTTSADGTISDIRWAENGVVFLIEGPQLTRENAMAIAQGV